METTQRLQFPLCLRLAKESLTWITQFDLNFPTYSLFLIIFTKLMETVSSLFDFPVLNSHCLITNESLVIDQKICYKWGKNIKILSMFACDIKPNEARCQVGQEWIKFLFTNGRANRICERLPCLVFGLHHAQLLMSRGYDMMREITRFSRSSGHSRSMQPRSSYKYGRYVREASHAAWARYIEELKWLAVYSFLGGGCSRLLPLAVNFIIGGVFD
jgi:hypothetical protein